MATNKEIKKKVCPICGKSKAIATGFYKSSSPLYQEDKCVPICICCVKDGIVNSEDGTINKTKLKTMLQRLDKPLYWDDLDSAYSQYKREHGYLSDDEVAKHGKDIIGLYFKNAMLRQNRDKSFADSEKDNFIHSNSNTVIAEKDRIKKEYVNGEKVTVVKTQAVEEPLIYSDKWMGNYSESDIKKLDHYYESLENDYNIVTENHRDYARKIAKASLQMDKTFDDMMNGIDGADKRYENATKAFDTLSKSAKFSESTRSVNDVGASSFSKVAAMVESHNWIPEHKPLKKDTIDELIDYLSTITKSV
nr:MAG TPA: hypothetical protein [Caudoviricetes sp.]